MEPTHIAENDRHVPMVETPNLDGKIPCLCGERFATWRDWCRHRGEQSDGSGGDSGVTSVQNDGEACGNGS